MAMVNNRIHVLTAFGLYALVVTVYLLLAYSFPVAYIWATYEDLYGEWGQTFFYMAACLFSLLMCRRQSRYRWFFVVLALATFYVFMEEISWGQRIIGFESPDVFKRYNLQNEANIHNLLVGPISTTTKEVVEWVLASALFLYGVLYPLTLKLRWRVATWFDRLGFAAPPFYLWPYFLTAAWLELAPFGFNEAEVAEILVGSSLAFMTMHYWLLTRRQLDVHDSAGWPPGTSTRLAVSILLITVVVASLSLLTTRYIYADDVKRDRIDRRVLNGYEKFAKRYERFGRLDITAELLERVHGKEPGRTSILRRIAKTYRAMGDEDRFRLYNQKALDVDLAIYAKKPDKISTNISLARTYRQRGETEKVRFHAKRAREIALARVEAHPDSAHAAYWLAKTYRLTGDRVAALMEYKRALELKPGSTKYRRAYYSMRRQVPNVEIVEDTAESESPGSSD